MKRTLMVVLSSAVIFVSGCASAIKRTGYQLSEGQSAKRLERCPVAIQCNANHEKTNVEVLGSINASDTGFSVDCDEAYVLDIFCKEACALGADLVLITEEKQPDFWSTCYRARAEFLRFKDRDKAKDLFSDARYAPELIIDRSEISKKRTRAVITGAVMGGVLGGIAASAATNVK